MEYKTFVDICNTGTLEEVRGALANGADVNERDEEHFKMTGLMRAVVRQNEPLVSLLLQQPGIQVNAKDDFGGTALHLAAFHNIREEGRKVTRLLLNFPGIDTEITNIFGQTPLMFAKASLFGRNEIFEEEYQKKVENDKAREVENIRKTEEGMIAEKNSKTRKRKREKMDDSSKQTNMWKKLKCVKRQHKDALEQALRKNKKDEEELVKMEEKMVEELDKEFEDKMAALVKEKQERRSEIAEKVKVKKEKQAKVGQSLLNKLKKEHKAAEVEVVAEMLKQADEEEEEEKEEEEERTSPPTPDCPICYEPMTPPTRIFQCGAGHLVCGACKPKLQVFYILLLWMRTN